MGITRRGFMAGAGASALAVGAKVSPAAAVGAAGSSPAVGVGTFSLLSRFSRMFPSLQPFTDPTPQQLAALTQTQLDPGTTDGDNLQTPAGFTYFGQFIDHDLTRDETPSPVAPVDPTRINNHRTFRFDLDSVYGRGPFIDPQLYAADGRHLAVQNPSPNGVRDLPRNPDGTAIVGDSRNDENEIISQLHTGMLMFHNAVLDHVTSDLLAAYETVVHYYQWTVLHEYLPTVCGQAVVDGILNGSIPRFYRPGWRSPFFPDTPIEWAVAAFRFGHSEVRPAYEVAEGSTPIDVFSFTAPDLRGGRPLPGDRQIAWGNFFAELTQPGETDGINHSRKIDPLISLPLFQLPIPPVEAQGSNVLAFRNMIRGLFYGLPSGQAVAAAMGTPVYSPASLALGPGFDRGTPLWYYNLYDSSVASGGLALGPLGARIVADVLIRLLQIDPFSILNMPFTPQPPIAPTPGQVKMSDLLVFAGVATRP